jgi:hypothetical protein
MAISSRAEPAAQRVLRYVLLDAIDDGRGLLRRWQDNEHFRQYVLRRRLRVSLPAAILLAGSFAFAAATVFFIARAGSLLALAAMMLAPVVLIASALVQGYLLVSWLEGRALLRALGRGRAPAPGRIARWLKREFALDLRPAPSVPWPLALVFVFAPLAMLARLALPAALALIAAQVLAAIVYARLDR